MKSSRQSSRSRISTSDISDVTDSIESTANSNSATEKNKEALKRMMMMGISRSLPANDGLRDRNVMTLSQRVSSRSVEMVVI